MTGLFLLSSILQLAKSAFTSNTKNADAGASYAEIAADYLCNLASGIVGNSAYDKYKETLSRLKQDGLPVSYDVENAVEKAVLLATLEAVKFCMRSSLDKDSDYKKLLAIETYLDNEVSNLNKKDYVIVGGNPLTMKIEYLNLSSVINVSVEAELSFLKKSLADYILRDKILLALYVEMHDDPLVIPPALQQCLEQGWTEKGNSFTLFNFACDYFHEFIKSNERISAIIDKQWLSDLLLRSEEMAQALNQIEAQFKSLGGDMIYRVGRLDSFLQFLNPQPFLTYQVSQLKLHQYTHYRSRFTPFLGRENELHTLRSFVHQGEKVSWMLVSGSGGSGKSRLAMELCYEIKREKNVLAGFMNRYEFEAFDWIKWQPESTCLVILDYAASVVEIFKNAIRHLYERQDTLAYPIRFLLLERMTSGTKWFKDLQTEFEILNNIPPPFAEVLLTALEQNHLTSIISHMMRNSNQPQLTQDAVESIFNTIDREGRPLFAVLAGIFLSEGTDMRGWNKEKLLETHYIREESLRKISPLTQIQPLEKMSQLVALATMTGGLGPEEIKIVISRKLSFLPSSVQELQQDQYTLFAPFQRNSPYPYHPMEPDLIGEYFVLKQLEIIQDSFAFDNNETQARLLRDLAWELRPGNMSRFTTWIFEDFPNHPLLSFLLEQPSPIKQENVHVFWSNTLHNLVNSYSHKEDWHNVLALYHELQVFFRDHTSNISALILINCTKNLIGRGEKWASPENIATLVNNAASIVNVFPTEKYLWGELLECVQVAAQYGYFKKDVTILSNYFSEWLRLVNTHKEFQELEDNILRQYGKMLRQFIRLYAELGFFDEADKLFDHFANEYEKMGFPPTLALFFLDTVNICLTLYNKDGKMDRMEKKINFVIHLGSGDHEMYDEELSLVLKKYISVLAEAGTGQVVSYLKVMKQLALTHGLSVKLITYYAEAAVLYITSKRPRPDLSELEVIHADFMELYMQNAFSAANNIFYFLQIRGLVITLMGNAFDVNELETFYKESLAISIPEEVIKADPILYLTINAKLIVGMIKSLTEKQVDISRINEYLTALKSFYYKNPSAEVAESLVFGILCYASVVNEEQNTELWSCYELLVAAEKAHNCSDVFYLNLCLVLADANFRGLQEKQFAYTYYTSIKSRLSIIPPVALAHGKIPYLLAILFDKDPVTSAEELTHMQEDFFELKPNITDPNFWLFFQKELVHVITEDVRACTPFHIQLFTTLLNEYGKSPEWKDDLDSFQITI